MAERTENYSTDFVARGHYDYVVKLRMKANELLTKAEFEMDQESEEQFRKIMKVFVREMSPKYIRRKDIDRPKLLEEKRVENMSLNELETVLQDLIRLQEALGITSMAKNEYEIDTLGAVDAEADKE